MLTAIPVELLDDVVSFLPKTDALQFACTCRAAYASALPTILSDVALGSGDTSNVDKQLQSFCGCLSADLPRRSSYIRSFTFGESVAPFLSAQGMRSDQDNGLADCVARILSHATNLREITVLKAERLFSSASPQIAAAITALKGLFELRFEEYVGPHALGVLSAMRSRPVMVKLASYDVPMCQAAPGQDPFLCNLTESLVSLTLINNHGLFETCESGKVPPVVFPRVEHLVLGGVWDIADLPSMARAFPGVRKLEVYTRCTENSVGRDLWASLDTVLLDRPIPLARPVRQVEFVGVDWVKEQFGLAIEMMAVMKPAVLIYQEVDYQIVALLAGCTDHTLKVRGACKVIHSA